MRAKIKLCDSTLFIRFKFKDIWFFCVYVRYWECHFKNDNFNGSSKNNEFLFLEYPSFPNNLFW